MRAFLKVFTLLGLLACEGGGDGDRNMAAGTPEGAREGPRRTVDNPNPDNSEDISAEQPIDDANIVVPGIPETVTYDNFVQTTLANACVSCHSAEGQASQLLLDSYDAAVAAIDGMLARTADDENPMPPNSDNVVRAQIRKTLQTWSDQGLLQTEVTDPAAVVQLFYNDNIKTAIDNACVGCHVPGGQAAFLPLTAYAEVVGALDNSIARIKNDAMPMPPAAGAADRASLAQLLEQWQAQGMPENP